MPLPVNSVAQQQRAAVINFPTDICGFQKVVDGGRVVDEDTFVPEMLSAPSVVNISAGSGRVDERAIGESLRRNRTIPVITDGVGFGQSVDDRQRSWREAVHDNAGVNIERRSPVLLCLLIGLAEGVDVIYDEALHIGRRCGERNGTWRNTCGSRRRVELLHIDMLIRLVRVREGGCHIRSGEDVSHLAVGSWITHRVFDAVKVRVIRIQPAQNIIERAVLHHQHNDVFYFIQIAVLRRHLVSPS